MTADISIVILCYKAGKNIIPFTEKVINTIETATKDWELVLVGNYNPGDTTDETPQVVRELATKDARIISVTREKQGMMGWDARTGLAAATGNTIALIDGDGQMPPEDVVKVYKKLTQEKLDIVKTFREKRYDGVLRKFNSEIFNILFNVLFPGYAVRDVNSKPKIMTRNVYDSFRLHSNDWFLDAEMMIQARRHHYRLGEVSTIFYEAPDRKSFVKVKHIFEFLMNFAKARAAEFFIRS